jgi:hypothetical protein
MMRSGVVEFSEGSSDDDDEEVLNNPDSLSLLPATAQRFEALPLVEIVKIAQPRDNKST